MKIGHKMEAVEWFVRKNPGCTKLDAGRYAWGRPGAEGNMGFLYNPVDRAIRAGLIKAEWMGNRYSLTPAD